MDATASNAAVRGYSAGSGQGESRGTRRGTFVWERRQSLPNRHFRPTYAAGIPCARCATAVPLIKIRTAEATTRPISSAGGRWATASKVRICR